MLEDAGLHSVQIPKNLFKNPNVIADLRKRFHFWLELLVRHAEITRILQMWTKNLKKNSRLIWEFL